MDNRQHQKTSRMAQFLASMAAKITHSNPSYQNAISRALPPTYFQGIDGDVQKENALARRRAKNKVARRSRRVNRITAKR